MFRIFESEEKRVVKSHLRQMVRLAMADGEFHKDEKKFILKVAKANDISRKDVDKIMDNPKSVDVHIPKNKDEKFDQIFDLVNLMTKAGRVTDAETEFCQELANRLGFRNIIVGDLVAKIERGIDGGLNRKQIKRECASFINY